MRSLVLASLACLVSGCPGNVMCIRAVECVSACGMAPITAAGCGPCPAGTFDVLLCRADAGDAGGTDAGVDGGGSIDAGVDAGGTDTGTDAPSRTPDGVACGGLDCSERCCTTDLGRACAPTSDACDGAIGIEDCDGPEDCDGGEVCCVTLGGGGVLRATCDDAASCPGTAGGEPPWRSCHEGSDCASGVSCCPSATPELSSSICGIGC